MNSRNTTVQLCPESVYPHFRQNAFLLSWLNVAQNAIRIDFFSEKTTIFRLEHFNRSTDIRSRFTFLPGLGFSALEYRYRCIIANKLWLTVMKIMRPSAQLLLANTCFCKMHLKLILFKPIMSGSGRPTGGRLIYGQKKYSLQCYQGMEAGVCHFRAERSVQCHFL